MHKIISKSILFLCLGIAANPLIASTNIQKKPSSPIPFLALTAGCLFTANWLSKKTKNLKSHAEEQSRDYSHLKKRIDAPMFNLRKTHYGKMPDFEKFYDEEHNAFASKNTRKLLLRFEALHPHLRQTNNPEHKLCTCAIKHTESFGSTDYTYQPCAIAEKHIKKIEDNHRLKERNLKHKEKKMVKLYVKSVVNHLAAWGLGLASLGVAAKAISAIRKNKK